MNGIKRVTTVFAVLAMAVFGFAVPAHAAIVHEYAGGRMTGLANHDGVRATLTVESPTVNTANGDVFSLAQISGEKDITAVGAGSPQRNIVEIGWHVYPGIHGGSTDTRLFVSSWVNGVHKGYNASSGCIDYPGGVNAGDSLTALGHTGTAKQFSAWHTGSAWEMSYNGNYICYIPDTVWTGNNPAVNGFTTITRADWFGEIVTDGGAPHMGDGSCGHTATAPYTQAGDPAYITSAATILAGSTVAANMTTFDTTGKYTVTRASNTTVLYGGDRSC